MCCASMYVYIVYVIRDAACYRLIHMCVHVYVEE